MKNQEHTPDTLLKISDAAKVLNLHSRTIVQYIRNGQIEAFKVNSQWRIPVCSLEKFLRESPGPRNPTPSRADSK